MKPTIEDAAEEIRLVAREAAAESPDAFYPRMAGALRHLLAHALSSDHDTHDHLGAIADQLREAQEAGRAEGKAMR